MRLKSAFGYTFVPAFFLALCTWPPSFIILWPILAMLLHMCSAFSDTNMN